MTLRFRHGLAGLFFGVYASLSLASTPINDPELRQRLIEAINTASSFQDRYEAEVWLLDMSTRLKPYIQDDRERLQLLKNIHHEARQAKLQPELVLAVIDIESRFDRFAVSRAGAHGTDADYAFLA